MLPSFSFLIDYKKKKNTQKTMDALTQRSSRHTFETKTKPTSSFSRLSRPSLFPLPAMHFLLRTIYRHFSSLSNLSKIPQNHRKRAISQAQQALQDYLYITRSLSFTIAEHISNNSFFSLSRLISSIDYTNPSDFPKDINRFLRYHPINEFEFFFESIGIPHSEVESFLPAHHFFLSEQATVLNVARMLSCFGFPWNKLGKLYKEDNSIFGKDPKLITDRLFHFKSMGFTSDSVVGICLTFPFVLSENEEMSTEIDDLYGVLKRVLVDNYCKSYVEGNVDFPCAICRKVKVFYDLGCNARELGELMGKSWKEIFVDYSEDILVEKLEFFGRMNARKEDRGLLILRNPEILSFDLETPVFWVMHYLEHIGLSEDKLNFIIKEYPYVSGKNRLRNLPHLMRCLDLQEWFFHKIMNGGHHLLANVDVGSPDEKLEKDFKDCLDKIHTRKNHYHEMSKLDFLLGIGFGENLDTVKALSYLHGTKNELQERFDCLLDVGIQYPKLCKMLKVWPKILNQNPKILKEKISFLCNDIGCSLDQLVVFPGYLCFDLENRIRPRCRLHKWITESGLSGREYSLASILATSEKNFIARLFHIHPAVPKLWLEIFSCQDHPCKLYKSHSIPDTLPAFRNCQP